jgi:colicin import membrane protein
MMRIIFLFVLVSWSLAASAQNMGTGSSQVDATAVTPDTERARIATERAKLEAGFNVENAACYKKFLVNNCLDEVKLRRRDALAD